MRVYCLRNTREPTRSMSPLIEITRSADQTEANQLRRGVDSLPPRTPADQFGRGGCRMSMIWQTFSWLERHMKLGTLRDVPVATEIGGRRWASKALTRGARITSAKATSLKQATATICTKVSMWCGTRWRRNHAAFRLEITSCNGSHGNRSLPLVTMPSHAPRQSSRVFPRAVRDHRNADNFGMR